MRETALKVAAGWEKERITELVDEALTEVIDPLVFGEAVELIESHQEAGRRVYLVSASPEEIVMPLARHLGVDSAIATRARIDASGRYTGEVEFYAAGENKVIAIDGEAKRFDLDLEGSYAYSDSVTDLPMLQRVGHPVVVNPDRALLKEAVDRGWEIRVFEQPQPLLEGRTVGPPKPAALGLGRWCRPDGRRVVVALDSKASGTTGMVPVTAHGHSHGDGLPGGWERWSKVPMLRFVVGFIALIGFVTVVALVALWPTGEGRQQAIANADDLGLVSDRVNATVQEQRDGPCSYSTDDNPQTCRG